MSDRTKSSKSLYQITQNQTPTIQRPELSQIREGNMIKANLGKSKIRESSLRSSNAELSTKKAPIRMFQNKQNKPQIDDTVLKMISYGNLCRNIEQKNSLIDKQRQEILTLKNCLNDLKKNQEIKLVEDQRVRKEEIIKLKQQQKQYSQNLKNLQMMRGHFRQIKKKYDSLSAQKQALAQKYSKTINQNEELTILINNLKQQLELGKESQQIFDLQEETAQLRQDLRNLQLQKESNEIRSSNFQKRMNEYILKYNEIQGVLSQSQIKYYKLQKDCDNFKLDKEEVEQKLINLQRQCEAQRQIHTEQLTIFKNKLKKYEEEISIKDQKIMNLLQNEIKNDLGIQVEQLSEDLKRISQLNLVLKQQNSLQVKKWEKYVKQMMRQNNQQSQEKLRKQHQQYEEILRKKQRQNQQLTTELQKANQKLSSNIEQVSNYESQIADLQAQLHQQRQQEQKILQKIGILEKQINQGNDYLQNQNQALKSEIQTYASRLQQSVNTKQNYEQIIKKLEIQLTTKIEVHKKFVLQVEYLQKQNEQLQLQKQSCREEQFKEKKYYQDKYEREIEQYNCLSLQFTQVESQNRKLLKINTDNTIEISNLKADLKNMKQEIEKLIRNEEVTDNLKVYIAGLEKNKVQSNHKLEINEQKITQIDHYLSELRQEVEFLRQENCNLHSQLKAVSAEKDQLVFKLNFNQGLHIQQHSNHQIEIHNLLDRVKLMQQEIIVKNKCITQKDVIMSRIKHELEQHIQQIRYLSETVKLAEKKYQNMVHEYNTEINRWESEKNTWRWQLQCHQNQKKVLEHSRISADYDLDSSQTMIEILKEQNKQLQLILGQQIQRRNATIRELISEKKVLFEQLMQRN